MPTDYLHALVIGAIELLKDLCSFLFGDSNTGVGDTNLHGIFGFFDGQTDFAACTVVLYGVA